MADQTISTELQLADFKQQSFRQTLDQLHHRASSILSLTLQWKDVEDHFDSTLKLIDKRVRELHSIQELVGRNLEDVSKRERDLELVREKVMCWFREIEEREKEVQLVWRREVEERRRYIVCIEKSGKELESVRGDVEKKLRLLEEVESRFVMLNYEIDKKACELKLREGRIELKDSELEKKEEILRLKDEEVDKKFKEIELKEKQIGDKYRELVDNNSVIQNNTAGRDQEDANLHFTVNMDGKALQIFLNEHLGEDDSIKEEVYTALGFSSNPAKLVLDAMQGFYPPHLRKGDLEFKPEVVRRSCIALLEQLRRRSPEISPDVRNEAIKLSFNWITKMKAYPDEDSLEILGFLQLLASYGLASTFDPDELLTQLELVVQHSLAPGLFRSLGFADKISGAIGLILEVFATDIIQKFIGKKKYIEAIILIYEFELVIKFPPGALLNDCLQCSKLAAKRMRKADSSPKGLIEAANKRIADLRLVVNCIEDYNIEHPSLENLKKLIVHLEKENSARKAKLAVNDFKKFRSSRKKESTLRNQRQRPNKKSQLSPTAPVSGSSAARNPDRTCSPTATSNSVPVKRSKTQLLCGNKRPRTDGSGEDDPSASHCC